jgi:hypothetical protein
MFDWVRRPEYLPEWLTHDPGHILTECCNKKYCWKMSHGESDAAPAQKDNKNGSKTTYSGTHSSPFLNPGMAVLGSRPVTDVHIIAAIQRPWKPPNNASTETPVKDDSKNTRSILSSFTKVLPDEESSPQNSHSMPHRGMDPDISVLPPHRGVPEVSGKENVAITPKKIVRHKSEEVKVLTVDQPDIF